MVDYGKPGAFAGFEDERGKIIQPKTETPMTTPAVEAEEPEAIEPPEPIQPSRPFIPVEERIKSPEYKKSSVDEAMLALKLSPEDQRSYAESKALPNFKYKLKQAQEEYDQRVKEMGEQRATASMISLIAHIAAGIYGVEHGVDTSGIKFDAYDWAAEYNKIMDKYKIKRDIAASVYEAQATREQQTRSAVERMMEFQERQKEKAEYQRDTQEQKASKKADDEYQADMNRADRLDNAAENRWKSFNNELQQAISTKKEPVKNAFFDNIGVKKDVLGMTFSQWQASKSEDELKAMNTGIGAFGRDEEDERAAYQAEVQKKIAENVAALKQESAAIKARAEKRRYGEDTFSETPSAPVKNERDIPPLVKAPGKKKLGTGEQIKINPKTGKYYLVRNGVVIQEINPTDY